MEVHSLRFANVPGRFIGVSFSVRQQALFLRLIPHDKRAGYYRKCNYYAHYCKTFPPAHRLYKPANHWAEQHSAYSGAHICKAYHEARPLVEPVAEYYCIWNVCEEPHGAACYGAYNIKLPKFIRKEIAKVGCAQRHRSDAHGLFYGYGLIKAR